MYSPTAVFLSVALGFLTCADANLLPDPPPKTPSQVVSQYVSAARAGEFDKAALLTALPAPEKVKVPEASGNKVSENTKEAANSKSGSQWKVVGDEEVHAKARLAWITGDFAKLIHDDRLSIKTVKKESAKNNEARVEIILGNEHTESTLPWVFSLHKVNDEWKIYDLTTAGGETRPME